MKGKFHIVEEQNLDFFLLPRILLDNFRNLIALLGNRKQRQSYLKGL